MTSEQDIISVLQVTAQLQYYNHLPRFQSRNAMVTSSDTTALANHLLPFQDTDAFHDGSIRVTDDTVGINLSASKAIINGLKSEGRKLTMEDRETLACSMLNVDVKDKSLRPKIVGTITTILDEFKKMLRPIRRTARSSPTRSFQLPGILSARSKQQTQDRPREMRRTTNIYHPSSTEF